MPGTTALAAPSTPPKLPFVLIPAHASPHPDTLPRPKRSAAANARRLMQDQNKPHKGAHAPATSTSSTSASSPTGSLPRRSRGATTPQRASTRHSPRLATATPDRSAAARARRSRPLAPRHRRNASAASTTSSQSPASTPEREPAYAMLQSSFQPPQETCFMCGEVLLGDITQVNQHIDACLERTSIAEPSQALESSVTATPRVETGSIAAMAADHRSPSPLPAAPETANNFVEYTWAGETRVRATALAEGGIQAVASGPTVSMRKNQDIDDDLDVDEDDEGMMQFGEAQFSDQDLQQFMQRPKKRGRPSLRTVQGSHGPYDSPLSARHEDVDTTASTPQFEMSVHAPTATNPSSIPATADWPAVPTPTGGTSSGQQTAFPPEAQLIIDSLKARIREQEEVVQAVQTCLICMEPYHDPLTSVVCWHVHCEQCWLHTLATKKLCPQCQKITQPTDLRRVYL
ncbi:hypothetical protein H4R34_002784 [Dimargaris verticillata]|uniref:RING-type domain-containing protein n=1 Tax=Dimargaris verticillata TaxID=2761393 RepID=A0A9W8ED90_9FUNG|nr:hypothetical protein H4R34_002784 [Dimargaris verticillata]